LVVAKTNPLRLEETPGANHQKSVANLNVR
jgi:hypothetical protein